MNSKEPAMEWAADLKGPQSNDEWPQPWPQPNWFDWNQWYQGYYPNNAWSQPANSEWSQPSWPQPRWVGWNQWGNHQWSRPYDEVMPTTCTNDKSSAAAASFNTDKTSAAAVSWPGPWEEKADSATGTTPADLLQSKEQGQYWGDREFLEKNEQKDRKRRHQYRINLRERRWQAAERVAMVEEDCNVTQSVKKRRLSVQVMDVARKEAAAITALSETLPGTPVKMKQDATLDVSGDDQQKPAEGASTDTCRTPQLTHTAGENQTVLLTPWILQQYQVNRPMDGLVPHEWIERKDAKFRCSAHSRVLPLLSGRAPRHSTFAPPIGIQMIEAFKRWQAAQK